MLTSALRKLTLPSAMLVLAFVAGIVWVNGVWLFAGAAVVYLVDRLYAHTDANLKASLEHALALKRDDTSAAVVELRKKDEAIIIAIDKRVRELEQARARELLGARRGA